MSTGAEKPALILELYAALKRRSSTVAEADGGRCGCLVVDGGSRFLSGFAGSE